MELNKDKQIEEMANDVLNSSILSIEDATDVAKSLYNRDYRKTSDIAREIVEDIATLLEANWNDIQHGSYWLTNGRCIPLRELLKTVEKKYTEVWNEIPKETY